MKKNQDPGRQSWGASFFSQTSEDVARAVVAAAATVRPRPSVVYSAKNQNNNDQFQKLRRQVSKIWKGCPFPDGKKSTYNPEVLTSQKRQWTRLQLQALERKHQKEPTLLFENIVVVGLHPNTDIQATEVSLTRKKSFEDAEGSEILKDGFKYHHRGLGQQNLEPQVLFAYPPKKRLPLKYKDLLSFCFPSGLEARLVERTPSMSELNEILLGQEQLKRNDLSFVFRLKVADNATLYGCCMVVEEVVQKPPGLMAMNADVSVFHSPLSRFFVSAPRCYCILSKMPFFNLHFAILKSIFSQERLERITESISELSFTSEANHKEEIHESNDGFGQEDHIEEPVMPEGKVATQEQVKRTKAIANVGSDYDENSGCVGSENTVPIYPNESKETEQENFGNQVLQLKTKPDESEQICSEEKQDPQEEILGQGSVNNDAATKIIVNRNVRHGCHEIQGSSSSIQICTNISYEEHFRSLSLDDEEDEHEACSSGKAETNASDRILSWAKANNHHSLRIVCEYYQLPLPTRGSSLVFQPLEHLEPLKFHRFGDAELKPAGSFINLRYCRTSLELAEAQATLFAEEEAQALSVWTVATICGVLPLESVLAIFSAALLEKQIIVVCSNLGVLSAVVMSVIPLIRPFQWQSLLLPILPNSMLEFLDAPVPYIAGVKNRSPEVRSKIPNVILVDVNRNQVKTPSIPQLPQQRELLSALVPYHERLVSESYLANKRPVHEYTNEQAQAAEGFLAVVRSYLESLCSNLRAHTITNVQSNDDKVSLLLKESFIDSFSNRDRPFMKLFVDTQLFSVHTDAVLTFYQKE
ncbi:uncharacterized protein LOC131049560 isoform X1 [Cryptomeria japonica]|uniref:uncharacterized protein LOC131049560 isoform X1 n=1 Tax=Cryptomeria japonica TaxID=3369 RepID=UPI0027DA23C7|nr:uncharacterized protein LOC131049560 isoform X1 [Cryptomeria japonica]XP_057839696.2 uncharacterized protein LOC131049560 isoform X1 [Cryptomeria japonica]